MSRPAGRSGFEHTPGPVPHRRRESAASEGEESVLVLPEPPELPTPLLLELLATGDLELLGRLAGSSNNALLGVVRAPAIGHRAASVEAPVVYKPIAGERPLWDFPDGTLAHREVAAYLLSEAGGWRIVPPTVFRDGPFGPGMVQLWVPTDPAVDRVELVVAADPRLRPVALFDVVANNADRKVGHLIPTRDGAIFGVDHGICFHAEPKLRTVLWAWRGEPLTSDERARLEFLRDRVRGELGAALGDHLTAAEIGALRRRIERLLREPCFPEPDPDRPAIPWPPY
jgi:uncharacterized repeat protein (TIGR03843 family)